MSLAPAYSSTAKAHFIHAMPNSNAIAIAGTIIACGTDWYTHEKQFKWEGFEN